MAYDGITLRAISHELNNTILNGRIDKIYQPLTRELIFRIRSQGKNHQLLISADPTHPRLYLTEEKFLNPDQPPMFCMVLRKHLEGARINKISQWQMERILRIELTSTNEIGDPINYWLIIEIMGRHSNIILVNPAERTIIDAIHHVNKWTNSVRELLPGRPYHMPPNQDKENLLELSHDEINGLVENYSANDEKDKDDKFFLRNFQGISPLVSKSLNPFRKLETQNKRAISTQLWQEQITESLLKLQGELQSNQYKPCLIKDKYENYLDYSVIDLAANDARYNAEENTSTSDEFIYVYPESSNQLLDDYYRVKASQVTNKREASDILQRVHILLKRAENKIKNLHKDLETADRAEEAKLMGELLTANLHLVTDKAKEVSLVNYYHPEAELIQIPLDPRYSPSQNAQNYYKQYNKYKNSIPIIHEQIQVTRQEIDYLEGLVEQIYQADIQVIAEIKQELADGGYIKKDKAKNRKRNNKPNSKPLKYLSSQGLEIWVGRNNAQNDNLTLQTAHKNEIWLHTKDIPGSHVIIRHQDPDKDSIIEAAILAAYHSRAKDSSNVPVDYTRVRHVHKPNGVRPGYVIYEGQQTVYVTPSLELIEKLQLKVDNNG